MPSESSAKRVRREGQTRELEDKRRRGQVSCAECRRLKIKCDKQIPCQSCQRRGCASLCPNGSLATGQGTRFVLAATEHLHRRVARLTSRVRLLEDALEHLHPKHPLLTTDDDDDDDHDDDEQAAAQPDVIDAFGTLSIADHGISRFFGPTGGSESHLPTDGPLPADGPTPQQELALFSQSFPLTPIGDTADAHDLVRSHLPPWNLARTLADTYFEQVSWLYHGVTRSQVFDDMLPVIYYKQPPLPGEDYSSPHDLAVIFMIFAIGALVQPEPSNAEGEHFHQLGRAALALQSVLEKPSIVTIQALHLTSIYNGMSGSDLKSDTSMELTWSLITLASHLSQTVPDRDSARWGLSPKMVQRRRILFWDLFVADVWISLNTGRPPSFSLAYIDCSLPQYEDTKGQDDFNAAFEVWQFRFASECVAEVTSRTLTAEAPSYATIMDLDRKVREFPLPEGLSNPTKNDISASFMRCVLDHIRETVLMYIHRSFFAQAIIDQPLNPLKSSYAPSFTAAYRAASTILKSVHEQFNLFPISCSRFWTMWTFAFTAAVIFGTVVTRGPRSPLAQSAMAELEQALVLFTKASQYNVRALKSLPILSKLAEKARYALENIKATSAGDDWKLGAQIEKREGEEHDELAIFAGHTRFVSSMKGGSNTGSEQGSDAHKSRSASAEAPVPPPVPAPVPPPSQPQPQTPQQIMYTWPPPHQYDFGYVPSERTMQQQQRPEEPSPVSSSSSQQGFNRWAGDSIVLHPPVPQVPQPTPLHHHPHPSLHVHGHGHYAQHRIPEDRLQSGLIELHPPYYSAPTSSVSTHDMNHTHTPPPPPPQLGHSRSYSSASSAQNITSTARATAAAAAYTLDTYPRYAPPLGPPPQAHHQHSQTHVQPLQHPHHPHHGGTAELADLGLSSRDSRLDERWSEFMADSGLLEGINFHQSH
ncbi:hypothetical protein P691DRAFT_795733 [Macrolepiota fuliginosa MF-IS2]|uniref:Zn(2)-C6 fungal-type domain-containing protein n=1 Tax=Macrolepiota fuliginosa MF-IS2 TaxID=1400762 RepID=A0A9P5X8D5_9AGAR|nr:hypothetical protein P691DRAFT_795733 [Macrolepiota fuliginosa MF-IS2]